MEATSQFEASDKSRIFINVGGFRHQTHVSTLKNIPDTRLSWIAENVSSDSSEKREFFYDRHPGAFTQILNYYRTGKLHYPTDMCGPMFEEELLFWGIDEKQMEPCCWAVYTKHREAEENLKAFVGPGFEELKQDELERSSSDISGLNERRDHFWKGIQPKIWNIMDEPHSSQLAKAVSYLSCFFISLSIAAFCASTLPGIRREEDGEIIGNPRGLAALEIVCSSFFTLEFLIRVIFCPKKIEFFQKPMNWIDLISILPFYVSYFWDDYKVKMFLVIRVLRLFRFVKLSYGLQIMIHTLKASSHELVLLLLILLIPVVMFSSIVYYIEIMIDNKSDFNSVPQSFWWCLITMTTVGYGDFTPQTWPGKIIGGACAVCGVLIVALPISVIGSNFSLYYAHAQARLKLPMKQHRLVLGGVPGLLTKHQELSSRRKKKSTAVPNNLDAEFSMVTERTSLRSSMPHSPLLELRRASNRNAHDSDTELLGEEDERSVSSLLLKPSPQLQPRVISDKIIYSRRRPRRISGTLLVPRKSVPEETEQEEDTTQQEAYSLPRGLSRSEQGTAEIKDNNLGSNVMPTPLQPDSNQESVAMVQPFFRAVSPVGNEHREMDIKSPVKHQPDPIDRLGHFQKDDIRTKWFLQGTTSPEENEKTAPAPAILNGDISSSSSSQRPSLDLSQGSSEQEDSNHLCPLSPLRKRKSLSDSLLCTVSQDDGQKPNGVVLTATPSEQNINKGRCKGDTKENKSPNMERKQNFSKQNGSPFSHKKALYSNGPCSKHSDEEMNSQRNRTTTHPCYDPLDFPTKRRRNAACTVAILSPSERGSESDFLETKI